VVANYLGAESEEALQDGWFATGDIATLDPRGYMEIVDRKKDVIKSGGEWISSIALENAVIKHPSVARAAVIGKPDHRWSERPLMIVVPADSCQPSVEELREFLMELFPRWWVPEDIVFDNQLPLGPTGKVLKTQLRDKYLH
jgi:fatty-acyl-CoA synthase